MRDDHDIPHGPALTRRRLLVAGGAATAAVLVPVEARASTGPHTRTPSHLRRSSYASLRTPDFRLANGGASTVVRLDGVGDLSDARLAGSEDAFSLAFSGDPLAQVAETQSTLSHPELGSFELLVAPVGKPGARQDYEAIVNRSVGVPRDPPDAPPAPGAGAASGSSQEDHRGPGLRQVRTRRTPKGVVCTLTLERGDGGAYTLAAWLMRRDRVVAVASRRHVRRDRVVLRLEPERRLRRGRYDVVVVATDADGGLTSRRTRLARA